MTVKNVEKLEKSRVAVTVEVGAEEFEAAVAKAYAKARGKLSIPGFRPGKAPRKMIEKLYGAGVFYSDAVDIALPEAYTQAIGQSGLDVVGYPEIEIVDDKIDENGFTFKATVAVYPEVKLGEYKGLTAEKEEIKKAEEDNKALFDFMTEKLGGKGKAVKLSQRLMNHPLCVTSEGALSVEMEKVLSAMPDEQAHTAKAAKILEINASHPIFEKLKKLYAEDKKDTVAEYADILYSQALLIEGMPIEDPVEFTNKLCTIMAD